MIRLLLVAWILLNGKLAWGRLSQTDSSSHRLGIRDLCFTINDRDTFLYGISYYGALGATKEISRADLDRIKSLGLNWIRVWATWGAFDNNLTVVNADGSPREPFLSQLQWLVAECDKRGIIVDVTLSRGNGVTGKARLQELVAHQAAVETIIAALKTHGNWYLDLSNERNIKDQRYTPMADLVALRLRARELMPSLLVTASHAGDIDEKDLKRYLEEVKVEFLSPHRPRDNKSPSQTEAKTRWYLDQMKVLGRVVPVHYQEPFRRDFSSNWNPLAADFVADAKAAFSGGAAGWCLHNGDNRSAPDGRPRRSFDLRDGSLFAQLDVEERNTLNQLVQVFTAGEYVVGPVPNALRQMLKLDEFYQKHLDISGFAIVGSAGVTDNAIREAAWILRHMMAGREDILKAMADKGVWLTVMAYNEFTTDVPEHRNMKPKVFWDRRARGLGGSPVSCAEENMLCYPGDPYSTENILIHEFAHAVEGIGLRSVDPSFGKRLRAAYDAAIGRGLWKGTYAGQNRSEYWAEGVQDWFDNNRQNDSLHNHVNTRAELKEYDPELAKLCEEVFGDNPWTYRKPMDRDPAGRAHLIDFDPSRSPRFRWREEAISDLPRVLIQTEYGDIELELDARKAPQTVKNFLRYVHEGFYSDGTFFRTVTMANQPNDSVKIQVVQVQANPAMESEFSPPIPLERTRDTGLRHIDGALSMARAEPDTAQDSFSICVGDQPELDFGGKRNPDGQGFATFGKVVKGMDVVRKIHASPAEGQKLNPAIRIQRAVRLN